MVGPRAEASLPHSKGDSTVGLGKEIRFYSRQDKEPLQGVQQAHVILVMLQKDPIDCYLENE